ncbi:LLM class F420-dependent oxidoreductase [Nakamurella endophytica]|uniref:LLM class F420-dependent oxidoreductase n=1 Tax=Nakamurella endophytica TaxID=1748367 RepID=A0A917SME6_9ACTN|nr:LLM class F420-dependent oxidoreductase [Nakamurella endophytica]GGL86551.1 LLM class F420-dependent oxidoreductase [Nakamurella endophytica]
MQLGIQIPSFTWPGAPAATGATFRRIAVEAEQAGLASLWVMDHFFQIRGVGAAEEDMLEGWSALAFAAGATERIKLGTMVTGVTYRYPGLLVKTATTLDVLSGGRAYFGIGAAWNDQEHDGLGVPFPPLAERFERLEETLQLALQMWRDDDSPFEGRHYRLARPLNHPQPVTRPHPPILVGGSGEKKTLRLVASYAQGCNIFEMAGVDVVRHKLEVLQQHCAEQGRDYAEIEKTTLGTLRLGDGGAEGEQSVEQAVDRFEQLAAIGVDQAIVNVPGVSEPGVFDRFAELARRLEPVTPAGR